MAKKITIIGSGAMGTACANVLVDNKNDVVIYGINEDELNDLSKGFNKNYFPHEKLNKFSVTKNLKEALENTNFVLLAVPSKFLEEVVNEVLQNLNCSKVTIINVCKGFYPNSSDTIHQKLNMLTKENKNIKGIVSLIGPSFALEIVKKAITCVVGVSNDIELIKEVQNIFSNNYFKVLAQTDVIGAEIGSIYKNIIAIGSGLLIALNYTINTQASFLTFALKEMKKFCKFLNGKEETLNGLSGLGDMILTSMSNNSRNFTYGKNFFNGQNKPNVTVEGIQSIKTVYEKYVETKAIKLPIVECLYRLIFLNENPNNCINELIKLIPKYE